MAGRKKEPETLVLDVEVRATTTEDMADTLIRIASQLHQGYTSGFDRNEATRYNFKIVPAV